MFDIKEVEAILNLKIKNPNLFKTAFIHKSYANEHEDCESNERLEFLGDAVLELIVTNYLFNHFSYNEGKMTKMRSYIVSGERLAGFSKKLGFGEMLFLSAGEKRSGGHEKSPILANLFEAFIGAFYQEFGFQKVESFVLGLVKESINIKKDYLNSDHKSLLQEIIQRKGGLPPEYQVVNEYGMDHEKTFETVVIANGEILARGIGSSKKFSEVDAAKNALEKINDK